MLNRLQKIRWEKGWSQQELSDRSGVSKTAIGKIENHQSLHPTVDVAYKLSVALEMDVWDIFYEE